MRSGKELKSRQSDMKERWAFRRKHPVTGKLISLDMADTIDIEALLKRRDLVCGSCKTNSTTVNKWTGEMLLCKPCKNKQQYLKVKYKLTLRSYNNMMSEQSGRCAICTEEKWHDLVVDHCHSVGHVRGLLCYSCNSLLGLAKDNDDILTNATKYLKNNTFRCGWNAGGKLRSEN